MDDKVSKPTLNVLPGNKDALQEDAVGHALDWVMNGNRESLDTLKTLSPQLEPGGKLRVVSEGEETE